MTDRSKDEKPPAKTAGEKAAWDERKSDRDRAEREEKLKRPDGGRESN